MKTILLYALLFLSIFATAQNNDYFDRMEHVFGNIDKNKVTTGYLKDFGIRFANMEECDGTISSENYVNENEWQLLYNSLHSMRVGNVASSMESPQTVTANLKTLQNNTENVLIAVEHFNYQQYKENAYTNGDVTISNERIYDVAGRNPYETKTLFASTTLKQHCINNTAFAKT